MWNPSQNIRYIKALKTELLSVPSKNGIIQMFLLKGYAVEHLDDVNTNPNSDKSNWAKVKYKDITGYIRSTALSESKTKLIDKESLERDEFARYISTDDVILFSNTNPPLKPILNVPKAGVVLILDKNAGESFLNVHKELREWSKIQYKDTTGYVIKSSLSKTAPQRLDKVIPVIYKGEENIKTKINITIYQLPSEKSKPLRKLQTDVFITDWYHTDYIYSHNNDDDYSYWILINYEGIKGYCKPISFIGLNWIEDMYAETDWSGFTDEEIKTLKEMMEFVGYNSNVKDFVEEARKRKNEGKSLFFTKEDIDFDKPMELRKEAYLMNRPNWWGKPIALVPKGGKIEVETDVNYWKEKNQSYIWMFVKYEDKTGYIPNMYMGEIPEEEPLAIGEERLRKLCWYYAEIIYKLYDKYRSFEEAIYNAQVIMMYSYENTSHQLAIDGIHYIYKVWQDNLTGMPVKYYFQAVWNVLEWAVMNKKTKQEMIETFEKMTEVFSRQRKYDFVSAFSEIITGKIDIKSRLSTLKEAFVL